MPRRPRIHIDQVPLHIVQRGHNREPCFFCEGDFARYLQWLDEALHETGCALHAYVLMTNHVHLLLTPENAALIPRLLMSLGRRYVQYVNRAYGRTGTLWDSRYRSSLVQADTYLLTCQRYIELNPVRAAMVADPSQHRWSSYRSNALGAPESRLTPHPLYLELGTNGRERRCAYRALFDEVESPAALGKIRLALTQNQPLGSAGFQDAVESSTGTRRVARPRGRPRLDVGVACEWTQGKDGLRP